MNAKNITAWIAKNKGKAALIALAILVLSWDWFAIPRLVIAMLLPLVVLSIPLLLLAAPVFALVVFFRRRARAQQAQEGVRFPDPTTPQYPEATPHAAPRRLTEAEIMDMYERYPERFEGVDMGDEIDRA